MTDSTFLLRQIRTTVTLEKGHFADGSNTLEIADLAQSVTVTNTGTPALPELTETIAGLKIDVLEQLTTLNYKPNTIDKNQIQVMAGDPQHGLSLIFSGTITQAGADFNNAPDVKLSLKAQSGYFGLLIAQGGSTISGSQDAASFISGQCAKAGLSFKNEGVAAQLTDCVFYGAPLKQARQAAAQIGADLIIDSETAYLTMPDKKRSGGTPLLNAQSGLIGYPTITENGVSAKCVYNPQIKIAGAVQLETIVPKASGVFKVVKLTHKLTANDPKTGEWQTEFTAAAV